MPVLALLTSCDWFGLREPESPGKSYWQNPTEPDLVLDNMQNALTYVVPDNYMDCLHDPFSFAPGDSVAGNYENWTRATEDTVIRNIMSRLNHNQSFPIQINEFSVIGQSGNDQSVHYTIDYDMIISLSSGEIYRAAGQADVNVVKNSDTQLWDMLSWVDYRTQDTTCWAEIKVMFRY